jgi:hypothetical protein
MRLFLAKDFGDARPMQVGCLANLTERQASFSGLLETLAPSLAGFIVLVASALKSGLGALHLGAGFPLRIVVHLSGSLFVKLRRRVGA